jgi:YD repeat-containing protein
MLRRSFPVVKGFQDSNCQTAITLQKAARPSASLGRRSGRLRFLLLIKTIAQLSHGDHMTKRTISLFWLLIALCLLGPKVQAQNTNSCTLGYQVCCNGALCGGSGTSGITFPAPAISQCDHNPSSSGCAQCWARSSSHDAACAPTDVAVDCPTCPKPAEAGGPINLATGNTYIIETDISIPGLGGGLRLTRTWNSIMPSVQRSYPFMFGTNWRSNFEQRLVTNASDGFLKYTQPDSAVSSYGVQTLSGGSSGNQVIFNAVVPANDVTTTITQGWNGSGPATTWSMMSQNGEKRTFDGTTGVLTSITDRNGNVTQLSYDTSNRLTTVADPAGRHIYFNYGSSSTNLVSTVTTDFGMTLSYTYDTNGRLTQVTKPDNTTVSFAYDSNSNIITVTDSNGKVLESHTYDASGRGLTSSRANGVDALTITY